MKVGVPTEIKSDEYRVALTPAGARELTEGGHEVLIQAGAGDGSSIEDAAYTAQGATIVADAEIVFAEADMVLKVKEPQPAEVEVLRPGQVLFTYLHLAADRELTTSASRDRRHRRRLRNGRGHPRASLPLLAPMSEIAGKLATQAGAFMLEKPFGGRGVLLGGVPGVAAATVMIIGGGVVGMNAAFIADRDGGRRVRLRQVDRPAARPRHRPQRPRIDRLLVDAVDRGDAPPRRPGDRGGAGAWRPCAAGRHAQQLGLMKAGAVLVDVAIDQGGCFETSRPTTHSDPTYKVDGVIHYCVANMPGAVPITSTYALTNSTLPYVLALADHGVRTVARDPGLRRESTSPAAR